MFVNISFHLLFDHYFLSLVLLVPCVPVFFILTLAPLLFFFTPPSFSFSLSLSVVLVLSDVYGVCVCSHDGRVGLGGRGVP